VPRVKKLLPVSAGAGGPAPTIGPEGWIRLEEAIGSEVAPKVRRKIELATRKYLIAAALERNAAPVSLGNDRVLEIKAAAAALYGAIMKPIQDMKPIHDVTALRREMQALSARRSERDGEGFEAEIAALKAKLAHDAARRAGERRTADLYIGASKLRSLGLASREMVRACNVALRVLGRAETEDDGYRVGEDLAAHTDLRKGGPADRGSQGYRQASAATVAFCCIHTRASAVPAGRIPPLDAIRRGPGCRHRQGPGGYFGSHKLDPGKL
jgi:hypothetical protein